MPQTLINVHSFLQDFNPTKFTVYSSCLLFSILLSLRLDNKIFISYWLVFLPLWIWKFLAILGASIGVVVWLSNPGYRQSNSSYIHFKSMLISVSLQLLLLMSELLICDNLENKRHSWTLAFVPLTFSSMLSISVCAWSIRNGRGFELEFFSAINVLQIVFIALKLDNVLNWSWIIVFVPTWILLCFATVIILYAMIFAAIVSRSSDLRASNEQQRPNVPWVSTSSMIFLPLLLFLILLTSKLDSPSSVLTPGYVTTCMPLFITFILLIHLSFGSTPGSLWWFGMRTDFCTFLLIICPWLKEFGNTSFAMNFHQGDSVANIDQESNSTTSSVATSGASRSRGGLGTSTINNNEPEAVDGQTATENSAGGNAKRLFYALRRILFRSKSSRQSQDNEQSEIENQPQPVVKLTIDTPD